MKKLLTILLSFSLLCSFGGQLCFAETQTDPAAEIITVGSEFPDFTVETTDGTFTLSESLKEKEAVFLNFWATYCGYCLLEFPYLQKAYEDLGDKIEVIGLTIYDPDTMEVIKKFQEKEGFTFPMGRDTEGLFWLTAQQGIPTSVIIDRYGKVVYLQAGALPSVEAVLSLLNPLLGDSYEKPDGAEDAEESGYSIKVADQNGDPVEGVFVNICTDTTCAPCESDKEGLLPFTGETRNYHIQVLKVPDGYSIDSAQQDFYTEEKTDITIVVTKN